MKTETFRVTISFDEKKEKDIINWLESLSEKRQIGVVCSNLVRMAFDNPSQQGNGSSSLSLLRQQYFNEVAQQIKAQDRKIDRIHSMCEDMYALARMNKVMGLESKAENMLSSQFILQRQQNELKSLLGVDNLNTPYLSEKLLNEKEKADKVMAFSLEVYEAMIGEVKSSIFKTVEVVAQKPTTSSITNIVEKQVEDKAITADEFVELVEKPVAKKEIIVTTPTGERAATMLKMLKGL